MVKVGKMEGSIVFGYHSCGLNMKPWPRYGVSRLSLSQRKNYQMGFSGKKNIPTNIIEITKRNYFSAYAYIVPGAPLPSAPPPNSHPMSWILGLVVSLVLPFFTHKWGPLWVVKNRIDNAVQTVEDIVEAVEKVAEKVDEIAEDIADDLPPGKLKDFMELIENVAEKTAKTADCIDNVIDKAQEAEEQIEHMIVESVAKRPKSSPKEQNQLT